MLQISDPEFFTDQLFMQVYLLLTTSQILWPNVVMDSKVCICVAFHWLCDSVTWWSGKVVILVWPCHALPCLPFPCLNRLNSYVLPSLSSLPLYHIPFP